MPIYHIACFEVDETPWHKQFFKKGGIIEPLLEEKRMLKENEVIHQVEGEDPIDAVSVLLEHFHLVRGIKVVKIKAVRLAKKTWEQKFAERDEREDNQYIAQLEKRKRKDPDKAEWCEAEILRYTQAREANKKASAKNPKNFSIRREDIAKEYDKIGRHRESR